jgi:hypothetical protein
MGKGATVMTMEKTVYVYDASMAFRLYKEDMTRIHDAAFKANTGVSKFIRDAVLERVVKIEGQPKRGSRRAQ